MKGLSMENSSTDLHNYRDGNQVTWESSDVEYLNTSDINKKEQINHISNKNEMTVNIPAEEGQTALHVAVNKGHLDMVRLLLEGGANVNKPDVRGCTPKSLAKQQENKSIYDFLLNQENKRNEHNIEFIEHDSRYLPKTSKDPCCSTSCTEPTDAKVKKQMKRVTIHASFEKNMPEKKLPKLIILPDSLEELLIIAGKLYIIKS